MQSVPLCIWDFRVHREFGARMILKHVEMGMQRDGIFSHAYQVSRLQLQMSRRTVRTP